MRNAQSAVEFVMIYGLGIIVVFLSIAAAHYMGVLDLAIFFKEDCAITPNVVCDDIKLTVTGGFTLVIKNALGVDMNNVIITINSTKCNQNSTLGAITKNQRGTINLNCENGFYEGEKLKGSIGITYTNSKIQEQYNKFGTFSIKAEA